MIIEAAEAVFAERWFRRRDNGGHRRPRRRPQSQSALLFSDQGALYRAVIGRVLTAWLAAASSFDDSDDPARR